MKGEKHGMWRGGIKHHSAGYIYIWKPNHPLVNIDGYVAEHRLVMEEHIGRYLTKDEHIHHINGNKQDNRIENLQILSNSEHRKLHTKDMSDRFCSCCGTDKTYINHGKYIQWIKHPITKEGYVCGRCYKQISRTALT